MDDGTERERKIVIRWKIRSQTEALGPTLGNAYPTDGAQGFDEALKAIDDAERSVWGDRDPSDKPTE